VKHIGGSAKANYPPLITLCVENPHAQIKMEDYNISYRSADMVSAATVYEFVLQKRIPLFDSMSSSALANFNNFGNFHALMPNLFPSHVSPDNFRIFPRPEPFDEVDFIRRAEGHFLVSALIIPGLEGGIDTLVALGKDFAKNGW
jgi:hypothetical protein